MDIINEFKSTAEERLTCSGKVENLIVSLKNHNDALLFTVSAVVNGFYVRGEGKSMAEAILKAENSLQSYEGAKENIVLTDKPNGVKRTTHNMYNTNDTFNMLLNIVRPCVL